MYCLLSWPVPNPRSHIWPCLTSVGPKTNQIDMNVREICGGGEYGGGENQYPRCVYIYIYIYMENGKNEEQNKKPYHTEDGLHLKMKQVY